MASPALTRLCALTTGFVAVVSLAAVPASAGPSDASDALRVRHTTSPAATARVERDRAAVAARTVVLVAAVRKGVDLRAVAGRAATGPAEVDHVLTPIRRISVSVPAARATTEAARLRALPGVSSVTRSARRYVSETPNDTYFAGKQTTYLNAITASAAWSRTHGSSAVKIGIVDTGADVDHPDLDGKIAGIYNAPSPGSTVPDDVGHGTFVAGVAAAETGNKRGVAGVGYDSSLLIAKVDYADDTDPEGYVITGAAEAAGIVWAADHGAQIINISLGSFQRDDTEAGAIAYAQGKGVLVVAAAGNENSTKRSYPAAYPGVIAVGATNGTKRASFSNHGAWVTVAAPGVGITSTAPGSRYATEDGTSFSSPLVAGGAALLLAADPTASADRIRSALTATAHPYAGLDLGAGRIDLSAALTRLTPTTTPTAPTITGTAGPLSATVDSSAPAVRYRVVGRALPLTPVVDGAARATIDSYGVPNGATDVTAADCTTAGDCGPQSPATVVTLDNTAPDLVQPVQDQGLTGAPATFEAAYAGGTDSGGIGFFSEDGTRVAFASHAPYSVTVPTTTLTARLSDGAHTITARQCDSTGARCAGPASPGVAINVSALRPSIASVLPSPFSPALHTTTVTFAPGTETPAAQQRIDVRVEDASGATVRHQDGLASTARSWSWNGRTDAGSLATNATYTVVITTTSTTGDADIVGEARRLVTLDATAPGLSGVTGNGAAFYPYRDGYRDTFTPTVKLGETANLSLQIRDAKRRVVSTITAKKAAGTVGLTWPGTTTARRTAAAGSYTWQFVATDAAGNRRLSPTYRVTVSARRLVARTTVLTRNGWDGSEYLTTRDSCAVTQRSATYKKGARLVNHCRYSSAPTFEIVEGVYRFTLPRATVYGTATAVVKGRTTYGRGEVAGLYTLKDGSGEYVAQERHITSKRSAAYTMGRVPVGPYATSRRIVEFTFALGNTYTRAGKPSDFDIATVSLKVTYKVLK